MPPPAMGYARAHASPTAHKRMELAAYSTVAMTLGLVVARPRLLGQLRLSPALAAFAGVAAMMLLGIVSPLHFQRAAVDLWSPFVTIAAIMVMTEVAQRVGLLQLWASRVEARARSATQLFGLVFGLGVLTSTTLNNDAAILLLTPLVVALVRRRYPDRPGLVLPFAFAVFISAGVAALPVSNPMNMVVADVSGIGFNTYTAHMLPVAIACWLLGFWVLRRVFRSALREAPPAVTPPAPRRASGIQRLMMALLAGVLLSYPAVGFLGGPVWAVASCGALLSLVVALRHGGHSPARVIAEGVSWETLAFLAAVLVMSMGLFEVGLVDRLTGLYEGAGVGTVGVASALGSAVLNNHPMAYLNMLALETTGAADVGVLAALVGGDLGPRLLPMGSLAGLLWIELLHRQGVHISVRRFAAVGVLVTVPTLAASLGILALY